MAAITKTLEFCGLVASTWEEVKPEVIPQIFTITPGMTVFSRKDRIKRQTGGTAVRVVLDVEENPSVGWVNRDTGTISIEKHDSLTANEYPWSLIAGSVWVRHKEAVENTGRAQIFELLRAKKDNLRRTMGVKMERALFGSKVVDEPYGLQDLVATDPTVGTIGLVNRANSPWFRNKAKDVSARPFSVYGPADMRWMFTEVTKFGDISDLVLLCDQDTYNLYNADALEQKQIVDKALGDIEFQAMAYMGRPLLWSPLCPAGRMYFLDMAHIWLTVNTECEMEFGQFQSPVDSIDAVAPLLNECQFVTDRPGSLGVLFGITE